MNFHWTWGPFPTGHEVVWVILSYCLGCMASGYYWTRWRTGRDIREMGSGSVGARNVGRALGPVAFTATFLLDAARGALVAAGAAWLGLRPEATVASMVAVVLGHNWPLQLGFHGGKGIAVTVGALMAYDPFLIACFVGIFLPVAVVLRNATLSAMLAFTLGPLAAFLSGQEKAGVAAMSFLGVLVLIGHRKNIREEITRMISGRAAKPTRVQMPKGPHDEA